VPQLRRASLPTPAAGLPGFVTGSAVGRAARYLRMRRFSLCAATRACPLFSRWFSRLPGLHEPLYWFSPLPCAAPTHFALFTHTRTLHFVPPLHSYTHLLPRFFPLHSYVTHTLPHTLTHLYPTHIFTHCTPRLLHTTLHTCSYTCSCTHIYTLCTLGYYSGPFLTLYRLRPRCPYLRIRLRYPLHLFTRTPFTPTVLLLTLFYPRFPLPVGLHGYTFRFTRPVYCTYCTFLTGCCRTPLIRYAFVCLLFDLRI